MDHTMPSVNNYGRHEYQSFCQARGMDPYKLNIVSYIAGVLVPETASLPRHCLQQTKTHATASLLMSCSVTAMTGTAVTASRAAAYSLRACLSSLYEAQPEAGSTTESQAAFIAALDSSDSSSLLTPTLPWRTLAVERGKVTGRMQASSGTRR